MESKSKKCIKKTVECKQLYKDYKDICGKDLWNDKNKCSVKDHSTMDIKELTSYVDYLIEKNNKYKTCYDLRIKHTKDCVNKKCWDRGHSKVVIQARTIFGDCKGILLKILTFINERKKVNNKFIIRNYQKLTKLYEIKDEDHSNKLKNLNEKLLQLTKRRDEIVIERKSIPANSYDKNYKNINKLKNEAKKINDDTQKLGRERKELLNLINIEKLKDNEKEEEENKNNIKINEAKEKLLVISNLQEKITTVLLKFEILDSDIFQYIKESESIKNDIIKEIDNVLYRMRNIKEFNEYGYLEYLFEENESVNEKLRDKIKKYLLDKSSPNKEYHSSFSSLLHQYIDKFKLKELEIMLDQIQKRKDIIGLLRTY